MQSILTTCRLLYFLVGPDGGVSDLAWTYSSNIITIIIIMLNYRCQKWWINTWRKDLNFKKDYKKIIQLALCEKHFTADQFMNPAEKDCFKPRKRLRKDAVPSLFDIPNPPKPVTERRRVLQKRSADNFPLDNVNWKRPRSQYTFDILSVHIHHILYQILYTKNN